MFVIALIACLAPNLCRPFEIDTDATTAKQCEAISQPLIAQWASGHTKWRPVRWSCRPPNKPEMDA